jgi:hypothetical protein
MSRMSLHCLAVLPCLLVAAAAAAAQGTPPASHGAAGDRCESAVADTVRRVRGKPVVDVAFVAGQRRAVPAAGTDEEIGVNGEGRYRMASGAVVPFTYTCAFNARTGGTSGVLFKDQPPAVAAAQPGSDAAWQPDLSTFSPQSCESATAALLKDRFPRAGRITFASETRKLAPVSRQRTALEGRGTVERAAGMAPDAFSFRCEFEPESGRVLAVRTLE